MVKNKKKSPLSKIQLPNDPLKAYRMGSHDGWEDGLNTTMNLVVWTLVDNELLSSEMMEVFHKRFMKTLEMVNEGYMTMYDIKKCLKHEYDWTVELK